MGMSQFKGIITVVTFLSITLILLGAAFSETPTFLTDTDATGPDPSRPNTNAVLAWNVTNAIQINNSVPLIEYEVDDWHWTIWYDTTRGAFECLHVYTFDHWWIFHTSQEDLTWYNETTGDRVSTTYTNEVMFIYTLEAAYDSSFNLNYRLTNSRGSLHITISWNTTLYGGDIDYALDNEGIFISLKQDFSDRQTTLNLMDIINGLFLGSLFGSNNLGIDPTISAIISIGLDSAIVYLVFSIVRSMIPLIPGGD